MTTVKTIELILTVPSVDETIAWYERVLGWQGGKDVIDADGQCGFGGVAANPDPQIYLCFIRAQGDPAAYRNDPCHLTCLVYVDDIDALYQRVIASGVQPDSAPADQFWGARTFHLRDLNGFHLNFAQKLVEQIEPDELQKRYEEVR